MDVEKAMGLVALGWLVGAFLLMARSVRRGRDLADALAARHPEIYEELGRPRPGLLQSVRGNRFAHFVGRREFEHLGDPVLSARFEAHRRSEARLLAGLLASLVAVFALVLVVRRAA